MNWFFYCVLVFMFGFAQNSIPIKFQAIYGFITGIIACTYWYENIKGK